MSSKKIRLVSPFAAKLCALDELVATCPPDLQRAVGELLDVLYGVLLTREKLVNGQIRIEPMKLIGKFFGQGAKK